VLIWIKCRVQLDCEIQVGDNFWRWGMPTRELKPQCSIGIDRGQRGSKRGQSNLTPGSDLEHGVSDWLNSFPPFYSSPNYSNIHEFKRFMGSYCQFNICLTRSMPTLAECTDTLWMGLIPTGKAYRIVEDAACMGWKRECDWSACCHKSFPIEDYCVNNLVQTHIDGISYLLTQPQRGLVPVFWTLHPKTTFEQGSHVCPNNSMTHIHKCCPQLLNKLDEIFGPVLWTTGARKPSPKI
jgi:hypothetical protein